jgi:hypothetical protein
LPGELAASALLSKVTHFQNMHGVYRGVLPCDLEDMVRRRAGSLSSAAADCPPLLHVPISDNCQLFQRAARCRCCSQAV